MIESLTQPLLLIGVLLATLLAAVINLLLASTVLMLYRRHVLRAMNRRIARLSQDWPAAPQAEPFDASATGVDATQAYTATRRSAMTIAAAGAVFALICALAALAAYPVLRSVGRFLMVLWISSWPIMLALLISMPGRRRTRMLWITAPFLLWAMASLITGVAALLVPQIFGQSAVEYFYTITPPQALGGWLLANLPPTVMWWLFGNRRLRAIGPLMLGFATALAAGSVALSIWLVLTEAGVRWLSNAAAFMGVSEAAVAVMLLLILLLASAAAGWLYLARARRAYLQKRANDRSLMMDALWLLFAIWYAMLLVPGGLYWLLVAVVAFGAYRLVLKIAQRRQVAPRETPPSLVFLRVFSLGRRSDQLFDHLTRYWRQLASVDLICGPDVVHGLVQPHQLIDFMAGRLDRHFIADPASLAQRLAERDLSPDADGRFRINTFYCHADTWNHVLPALVGARVVVLMDLRSLSDQRSGCALELHHLVAAVPLRRCVLVVDDSTDSTFLQHTLASAWHAMPASSPNRQTAPGDICIHRMASDEGSVRALLSRLCVATTNGG